MVGDRCAGLVATVDSMPPKAGCRRCMVHFLRNVLSKVPPTHREWASAALKAVFVFSQVGVSCFVTNFFRFSA